MSGDSILIAVLGGGLTPSGGLPLHSQLRVDKAYRCYEKLVARGVDKSSILFCSLSYGTFHKPNPTSEDGMPILESQAGGLAIVAKGVPPEQVLLESLSRDTIGNAVFLRLLHTEVRGIRDVIVVTNDWHFPRTRAIFDRVFALPMHRAGDPPGYRLRYKVAASGLDPEVHSKRFEREEHSRLQWLKNSAAFADMVDVHSWIFTRHNAYTTASTPSQVPLDSVTLQSY